MEIVMRKTDELIPYVNNARKNDHAVDAVASSIKNYGFKQPIVIDGHGEVVAGHTRLKAAKKLGLKEVPVIVADDLTPAQVKAYRIADNRVGELAEWDMELLQLELDDIEGFTGFEDLQLPNEAEKGNDDDFDAEKEFEQIQEPITQRGWIYKLGNHRLMCGDSTNEEDVKRLMDGHLAEMVFTDPPYRLTGGGCTKPIVKTGFMSPDKFIDRNKGDLFNIPDFIDWIKLLPIVCEKNAELFIMSNVRNMKEIMEVIESTKAKIHNILIMYKDTGFPHKWYTTRHEFILYYYYGSAIDPLKKMQSSVFEVKMPKGDNKEHASQKPIEMIEQILNNHPFEKIYEPFGGSGSTLIACEKTNRNCYAIELEPKYCDVIIKRWENMTGQKAERIE
jgi:DNA modification methylase